MGNGFLIIKQRLFGADHMLDTVHDIYPFAQATRPACLWWARPVLGAWGTQLLGTFILVCVILQRSKLRPREVK